MSPSPQEADDRSAVDGYAAAWSGLMALVRRGYSWSGHERNVAYLNTRDGRFADVSALAGLDLADDGRALAVTDWDRDGDLDLWFRNRTAPRLRLMLNERPPGPDDSVAVRLEGVSCNRDAVGSVVELHVAGGSDRPITRSVRAGDLFLSQSSKWLHFGLADGGRRAIERCVVRWPGGAGEEFAGVKPGGRFVLRQGTGIAVEESVEASAPADRLRDDARETGAGRATEPSPAALAGVARILLPAGVILPSVAFRDAAARPSALTFPSRPRLLVLWSAGCGQCRGDLGRLVGDAVELAEAGLEVVALSVDALDGPAADTSAAYELVDALGLPFSWGFLESESAARLARLEVALFDRTPPSVVPFALLVDPAGDVLSIYRGAFSADEVVADAGAMLGAGDAQRFHLAAPLAGSWFTRPMPRADVAEFLARQFQSAFPGEAMRYLMAAHELADGERRAALAAEVASRSHSLAREAVEAGDLSAASGWFERAVAVQPDSAAIRYEFAVVLAQAGRLAEAEAQFLSVLELEPDSRAARESLAMVRQAMRDASR